MIYLQQAWGKGGAETIHLQQECKDGGMLQCIIHQEIRQVPQLLQEEINL